MESINKIDLSSITNKDSDVYVIDATTLGGKSASDFALLNGNNMFKGSENYFQGDLYSITSGTITISSVMDNDQEITSNISMQPDLISISADGIEGQVYISAGAGPSYISIYDDELTLHMECDTGYSISNFNAYSIRLSAFDDIHLNASSQGSSVSVTAGDASVSVAAEGSVSVTARAGLWINEKEAWHKGNLTFKVTDNGTTLEITTK